MLELDLARHLLPVDEGAAPRHEADRLRLLPREEDRAVAGHDAAAVELDRVLVLLVVLGGRDDGLARREIVDERVGHRRVLVEVGERRRHLHLLLGQLGQPERLEHVRVRRGLVVGDLELLVEGHLEPGHHLRVLGHRLHDLHLGARLRVRRRVEVLRGVPPRRALRHHHRRLPVALRDARHLAHHLLERGLHDALVDGAVLRVAEQLVEAQLRRDDRRLDVAADQLDDLHRHRRQLSSSSACPPWRPPARCGRRTWRAP